MSISMIGLGAINAMFRVNNVATYIAMRGTICEPVIVTLVLYNDLHNTVCVYERTTYHRR
jgi:hypothetical protein